MNTSKTRFGAVLLGGLWTLGAGLPAVADDTELFVQTSANAGVRPNILFVIDNSGSMGTEVVTQDTYSPSTDYSGFSGACANDRVYYRTGTGNAPNCNTDRWFNLSALKCDKAIAAFTVGGQYIDKLVQYDHDTKTTPPKDTGERWETIDQAERSRPIECLGDAGFHGSTAADTNKYARDGSTSTSGYWGGVATQIKHAAAAWRRGCHCIQRVARGDVGAGRRFCGTRSVGG
jgi:type IV pilus assembly protein PilY1